MISLQQYLLDPCGAASIPYWKCNRTAVPQNMKIVRQREMTDGLLHDYNDEPYFRLYHDLKNIGKTSARDVETVSGKINNAAGPERLYRKCGFAGADI